jgi:imidazolonepropionase-like amidohydrolase
MKLHPGLQLANFDALVAEAHAKKMDFAGHVSFQVGVWHAIESGYRTIDHMDGFIEGLVPGIQQMPESETGLFGMYIHDKADQSRLPLLYESLKKNKVWVVPTQSLAERWMSGNRETASLVSAPEMVYISAATIESWRKSKDNLVSDPRFRKDDIEKYIQLRRKMIKDGYRAGVGFLLGSDAPQVFNVPGFSVHHELQYLVDAGLTPFEALRTGTYHVGQFLGRNDLGIVRKGAVADLILLRENPLSDIGHSRSIEGVMAAGRWYSRAELDNLLLQSRK